MLEGALNSVYKYIGLCVIGTLVSAVYISSAYADICFLPGGTCFIRDRDSCNTACDCVGSNCCPAPNCSSCDGEKTLSPSEGQDCYLMKGGTYCCRDDCKDGYEKTDTGCVNICFRDGYTISRAEWDERLAWHKATCQVCLSDRDWLKNCYEYSEICAEDGYHLVTAQEKAMLDEGSGECAMCPDLLNAPLDERYVKECKDYAEQCRSELYTLTEDEKDAKESAGYTCEVCPYWGQLYKCPEVPEACSEVEIVSCPEDTHECTEFIEGCGCVACRETPGKSCEQDEECSIELNKWGKCEGECRYCEGGCVNQTCESYKYLTDAACGNDQIAKPVTVGGLNCYECVYKDCENYNTGYKPSQTGCSYGYNTHMPRIGLTCYSCKACAGSTSCFGVTNSAALSCGTEQSVESCTDCLGVARYHCVSGDDGYSGGDGYSGRDGYSGGGSQNNDGYSGGGSDNGHCQHIDCNSIKCSKYDCIRTVMSLASAWTTEYRCLLDHKSDCGVEECCACSSISSDPSCSKNAHCKSGKHCGG